MKKRAITKRFILIFMAAIFLLTLMPALNAFAKKEMSTWDSIKKRGSIRYAAISSPPKMYIDIKTGKWKGYLVKYIEEIANTMGVKSIPVPTTWGTVITALQSGQIDLVTGLIVLPQRAMAVDFVNNPTFYMAQSALVHKNLNITYWNEMKNFKIAVMMGASSDFFITKKFPKGKIQRYPTVEEIFAAFQSGRADVMLASDSALIAYFLNKTDKGKIVIPKPLDYAGGYCAVRREPDKTWRDFLNACATHYYISGKVQEWFDEILIENGIDPKIIPSVIKERW
jgi:polar amino acid transport system substrate-binding protein